MTGGVRALVTGGALAGLLAACGSSGGATPTPAGHFRLGAPVTRTPGPRSASTHSLAGGGLPPTTLSDADIAATLDAHNAWRAKYNEPALVWDDGLASLAQDWSNQMAQTGNFDHRPDNNEGENIFTGSGQTYAPKDVVDAWGSEVTSFHADTNTCDPGAMCGHFTQIVWATTTKVGCGAATAGDGSVYWTCNYDPPGNVDGIGPFDVAAQQQASGS